VAKSLQRKKPGFTKAGEVKIVSLNYSQLVKQLAKNSKKKIESKIRNRMRILEQRKDFVAPVVESV
jgi:uncharacterized membrane protein